MNIVQFEPSLLPMLPSDQFVDLVYGFQNFSAEQFLENDTVIIVIDTPYNVRSVSVLSSRWSWNVKYSFTVQAVFLQIVHCALQAWIWVGQHNSWRWSCVLLVCERGVSSPGLWRWCSYLERWFVGCWGTWASSPPWHHSLSSHLLSVLL